MALGSMCQDIQMCSGGFWTKINCITCLIHHCFFKVCNGVAAGAQRHHTTQLAFHHLPHREMVPAAGVRMVEAAGEVVGVQAALLPKVLWTPGLKFWTLGIKQASQSRLSKVPRPVRMKIQMLGIKQEAQSRPSQVVQAARIKTRTVGTMQKAQSRWTMMSP